MAELIGSGINLSSINTWKDFEKQEVSKVLSKGVKKTSKGTTLALLGLMSLWVWFSSCCGSKTVEQEINDLVADKQEQVDKLTREELKLQKKLDKVKADKKFAEEELKDAKSKQK